MQSRRTPQPKSSRSRAACRRVRVAAVTTAAAPAHLCLRVAAVPENVAVVRHMLADLGDALALGADATDNLRLAASEACNNVVVHAYRGREDGMLEVEATVEPGVLRVLVRDCGHGIEPRQESAGLGMGLPLIAALSDDFDVATTTGGATEVRMAFALGGREPERRDSPARDAV